MRNKFHPFFTPRTVLPRIIALYCIISMTFPSIVFAGAGEGGGGEGSPSANTGNNPGNPNAGGYFSGDDAPDAAGPSGVGPSASSPAGGAQAAGGHAPGTGVSGSPGQNGPSSNPGPSSSSGSSSGGGFSGSPSGGPGPAGPAGMGAGPDFGGGEFGGGGGFSGSPSGGPGPAGPAGMGAGPDFGGPSSGIGPSASSPAGGAQAAGGHAPGTGTPGSPGQSGPGANPGPSGNTGNNPGNPNAAGYFGGPTSSFSPTTNDPNDNNTTPTGIQAALAAIADPFSTTPAEEVAQSVFDMVDALKAVAEEDETTTISVNVASLPEDVQDDVMAAIDESREDNMTTQAEVEAIAEAIGPANAAHSISVTNVAPTDVPDESVVSVAMVSPAEYAAATNEEGMTIDIGTIDVSAPSFNDPSNPNAAGYFSGDDAPDSPSNSSNDAPSSNDPSNPNAAGYFSGDDAPDSPSNNDGRTIGDTPAPGPTGSFEPGDIGDFASIPTVTLSGNNATTRAQVAALGGVDFSQEDAETLGRAIAGEAPASIVGKIARGAGLTDNEMAQVALIANVAATRALANAGFISGGSYDGSLADALTAGLTGQNAGQFSAFNANSLARTNANYAQNPGGFNDVAKALLDGTVAKERGLNNAAPVPNATHYFNPDVADPGWAGQLGDTSTLGDAPHSHTAGSLPGEYGLEGNVPGMDTLNQRALEAMNRAAASTGPVSPFTSTGPEPTAVPTVTFPSTAPPATVSVPVSAPESDGTMASPPENQTQAPPRSAPPATPSDQATAGAQGPSDANVTTAEPATAPLGFGPLGTTLGGNAPGGTAGTPAGMGTGPGNQGNNPGNPNASGYHGGALGSASQSLCDCTATNISGTSRPDPVNQSYLDKMNTALTALQSKYPGLTANIFSGTHTDPNVDPAKSDGIPSGRHAHGNGGDTTFSIDGVTVTNTTVLADIAQTLANVDPNVGIGYNNTSKTITHVDFEPTTVGTEWGYSGGVPSSIANAADEGREGTIADGVTDPSTVGGNAGESDGSGEDGDGAETDNGEGGSDGDSDTEGGTGEDGPGTADEGNGETTAPSGDRAGGEIDGDSPAGEPGNEANTDSPAGTEAEDEAQEPTVVQTIIETLRDLIDSIFGTPDDRGGERFTDFDELQATSTPYVPIYVTIDETNGTVQLDRGNMQGSIVVSEDDSEISYEVYDDSQPSLVLGADGSLIHSDGTYAPVTINGVILQSDVEYVYLVRRVRNGEMIGVETRASLLPGNILTNAFSRLFGDNSPFGIQDVSSVTYEYVDPDTAEDGNEYYDYTITLADGTSRGFALPVNTSLAFYKKQLASIGYTDDVFELTLRASEVARREETPGPGFFERIMDQIVEAARDAVDMFSRDDNEDRYTNLDEAGQGYTGPLTPVEVRTLTVHLNIPIICPDYGLANGYIYEVQYVGQAEDGTFHTRDAAFARCGAGGPRTYATEIAIHLANVVGFTTVSPDQLLEIMEFNFNTPNMSLIEFQESIDFPAATEPDSADDTPNTIGFEAKVTAGNSIVTDWTTRAVSVGDGERLHLRWNAPAYARCLPFIGDNGGYSFFHDGDLRMVSANTETEGFFVPVQTATYRIECEFGTSDTPLVHSRRIPVTAE